MLRGRPARLAAALLAALVLGPLFSPLAAGAPPASVASTRVASRAESIVHDLLLRGASDARLPQNASAVLDALARSPSPPIPPLAGLSGIDAYLAASGLQPTPAERAAIRTLQATEPLVAAQFDALAGRVAQARTLQSAAFAALTPDERAQMPRIVAELASGRGAALDAASLATLAKVDLDAMSQAASILLAAADEARAAMPAARAGDARYALAIPPALAGADGGSTLPSIVAPLVDGVRPVVANTSLDEILAQLANLTGESVPASAAGGVPADLAKPLADVAAALALDVQSADASSHRAVLATIANASSSLVRAAYNLSLETPGEAAQRVGGPRALSSIPFRGTAQAGIILSDVAGAPGHAPKTGLVQGLSDLKSSLGLAFTPEQRASAERLAREISPQLAEAMGTLLEAQAAYQRDLSPDAPLPKEVALLDARAGPLLASDAPLTLDDVRTLQAALTSTLRLRDLTGVDAGALLSAATNVTRQRAAGQSSVAPVGIPYADEVLFVSGADAQNLTVADMPRPPLLFVDLGGDDTYAVPIGGVDAQGNAPGFPAGSARTSIAIDLGGNDTYRPVAPFTLGAARGSPLAPTFGLLIDAQGADTYSGGDAVLGWGVDGIGIAIDAAGNDRYDIGGRGLGGVATDESAAGVSTPTSEPVPDPNDPTGPPFKQGLPSFSVRGALAAGIFVDVQGDDAYHTGSGYGHLDGATGSPAMVAAFADLSGNDAYAGDCPAIRFQPCLATPRANDMRGPSGLNVFIDPAGTNTYARTGDDTQCDGTDTTRLSSDPCVLVAYTREATTVVLTTSQIVPDRDGDGIPDSVDPRDTDPNSPFPQVGPFSNSTDSDGDGFTDNVELFVGTDPNDPTSYPFGLPVFPPPLPSSPGSGPTPVTEGHAGGMLLDVPGLLAIGLPGPTVYRNYYEATLDLGLENGPASADTYRGATASNGFSLDLAGDDLYQPAADAPVPTRITGADPGTSPKRFVPASSMGDTVPTLGAALGTGNVAALLDLGGDDRYRATELSLGVAIGNVLDGTPPSSSPDSTGSGVQPPPPPTSSSGPSAGYPVALLLDAGGRDSYSAPGGRSLAYATDGGRAYVLDLGSDADVYLAPTEGVVANSSGGEVAFFLDQGGSDRYDRGTRAVSARDADSYQGASLDAEPHTSKSVAAFLDLGGVDAYLATDATTGAPLDLSWKNDRLRASPTDDAKWNAAAIFLDADQGGALNDKDHDGSSDATEIAAGTSNADMNETPRGHGFDLNLPRLGLALGDATPTTFTRDYAVSVDQGGADMYRNNAGATTPRFPVALALDLGSDADAYNASQVNDISSFTAFDATGVHPTASLSPIVNGPLPSLLVGGAQGAGILGVGVLVDEGGDNAFTFNATQNLTCPQLACDNALVGAAQGAGILGVGVLEIQGAGANAFRARVDLSGNNTEGSRVARTASQGAGVGGVGILVAQSPFGNDAYALESAASGPGGANDTTGQGYASWGTGILLDRGGDNTFNATTLAQAVGEGGDPRAIPFSTTALVSAGMGALLLTGTGNDRLASGSRSQAYATTGATAVLFDALGDDERTLTPAEGISAWGQASAASQGTALLIDEKGNDKYVSSSRGAPDMAQGFADGGQAMLVDLSGSDRYQAGDRAQAAVGSTAGSFAALADRAGNDTYVLRAGGVGQGYAPPIAIGSALFVDAGGRDTYSGALSGINPLNAAIPQGPCDVDRNDCSWSWGASPGKGIGIDSSEVSFAQRAIEDQLGPAGIVVSLEITKPNGDPAGEVLHGTNILTASLILPQDGAGHTADVVDRVEFYDDETLIGQGVPSELGYAIAWATDAQDASGRAAFPDGYHNVSARAYPRTATPAAADDLSGTGAGVDVEPFIASVQEAIDNAPRVHALHVPDLLAPSRGRFTVPLWIDRDLERCPACAANGPIAPGDDDWVDRSSADLYGPATNDTSCTTDACNATGSAVYSGGAYLAWNAPASSANVVGYRIQRATDGKNFTEIAFVDARVPSPLRFVDRAVPGQLRSVVTYHVEVLRSTSSGLRSSPGRDLNVTVDGSPGLVTGLVAKGMESSVRLSWRAAPGATGYKVFRALEGLPIDTSHSLVTPPTTDTTWLDTSVRRDAAYTYLVEAINSAHGQNITSTTATARASPGANVTISLQDDRGSVWNVVQGQPFGGLQVANVSWDAAATRVPDGEYVMWMAEADGSNAVGTRPKNVTLDATPPTTVVAEPTVINADGLGPSGLRIHVDATDAVTGVARTLVAIQMDDLAWRTFEMGPNDTFVTYPAGVDGSTLHIVARSVDRAGNVEGYATPPAWTPTLEESISNAIAAGAWSTHVLDFIPPRGIAGDLNAVVRPGTPVNVTTRFTDSGGIASVVALVEGDRVPLAPRADGTYAGAWIAHGAGSVAIDARALDSAGNAAVVRVGTVTVDPEPPIVRSASITFSGGRTVGRAGEYARLVVDATDPSGDTLPQDVHVWADLKNASSRPQAQATWDGDGTTYTAEFLADLLTGAAATNVTVYAQDPAGNVRVVLVPVQVDGTRIDATAPRVVDVQATSATLNWTTLTPARGSVEYGVSPQLGSTVSVDTPSLDHNVTATGLKPDTDYYARVLSTSAAGIRTASDLFTFHSGPALRIDLASGKRPLYARDAVSLAARVDRYDGAPANASLDVFVAGPRGSPTILDAFAAKDGLGVHDVALRSLHDGDYRLDLRAHGDDGRGSTGPIPLVVDRQPPLLALDASTAISSSSLVSIDVAERGSGVDFANVTWTLGGEPCPPVLVDDALRCVAPDLGRVSSAQILVSVPDRAGNVATIDTTVAYATGVLGLRNVTVTGGDGAPAVDPGATATVDADINDGGLKSVAIDLRPLGLGDGVALARTSPGHYRATFVVPRGLRDGNVILMARATAADGHVSTLATTAEIDGTPPQILDAQIVPLNATAAQLVVRTDASVLASVRTPSGSFADGARYQKQHVVELRDLAPGVPIQALLTVRDRAGHEATRAFNVSGTPDTSPPRSVAGLLATDLGDGSLRLQWTSAVDDVGVAAHVISRTLANATTVVSVGPATSWTDTVPVGVPVTYAVAARDAAGNVGPTSTVVATSSAVPHLSLGRVDPPLGGPGVYTFTVHVVAAQDAAPEVSVVLDGVRTPMKADRAGCAAGCDFAASVRVDTQTLATGAHRFAFVASGGSFLTKFPDGDPLVGPVVVQGTAPPTIGAATRLVSSTGIAAVALAGAVAIAALTLVARRRLR